VKEILEKLDLFMFTVRLGETWVHRKSKKTLPNSTANNRRRISGDN
jgi:hypothetical protein